MKNFKSIVLVSLCSTFSLCAQQYNNNFKFGNKYPDLLMRKHIDGDLQWKRALVLAENKLILNYRGDIDGGTRVMGKALHVDNIIKINKANNINDNSPGLSLVVGDDFLYNNQYLNHYGFGFYKNTEIINNYQNGNNAYVSGFFGVNLFTNGENRLRINRWGNVGIGTVHPDSKLTVKGHIHCEEVRVDLDIPADYVFENYYNGISESKPEYNMLTLEEVEEFTKKNNHLPNIPSADEIKENGLQLKEMTNLLLQKIEELTLYTIEQEKRIKELESKNK